MALYEFNDRAQAVFALADKLDEAGRILYVIARKAKTRKDKIVRRYLKMFVLRVGEAGQAELEKMTVEVATLLEEPLHSDGSFSCDVDNRQIGLRITDRLSEMLLVLHHDDNFSAPAQPIEVENLDGPTLQDLIDESIDDAVEAEDGENESEGEATDATEKAA